MMLAEYDATCRVVLNGLCYVEEGSLYSDFLETFYHKWVFNFVKDSLCCFLSGIQVSQEISKVVCYYHFFKEFSTACCDPPSQWL